MDGSRAAYLVQFYLERGAIGEHVVIRSHSSLNLVNRRYAGHGT